STQVRILTGGPAPMPEPLSKPLDLDRVAVWAEAAIPGFRGPVRAEKTPEGQSNPTYVLTARSGRYVLRRKPLGPILPSAHAVEREFRVMRALGRAPAPTGVPVPRMLAFCDDDGVIGSPFFIMEHVAGRTFVDPRCPGLTPEARTALYRAMARTLAALHRVDIAALGLTDFGRPNDYFARQRARWTRAYRESETEHQPELETLIAWLERSDPPEGPPALVHGDWRIDNLRVAPDAPRIAAVLDWELSTLGHPLADLGTQLMQWAMPPGPDGRGLAGVDRNALGLPEDAAYAALYAAEAGYSTMPDLAFPIAFAFFRMAAILQGVKARGLAGNASNPDAAARLGALVPEYAVRALRHLDGMA
ncbi:MAG: phosphotransferase family protein, partial [Pseudomonadota bacterium]